MSAETAKNYVCPVTTTCSQQMGLDLNSGIWNWYSAAYSIMSSVIILRIADTRSSSLGELGILELEPSAGYWDLGRIACVSTDF